MERTTITVSDEVWRYLHDKKVRGDSMDDVLRRELGLVDGPQAASERHEFQPDIDREHLREELAGSGELLERRVDEILVMYDRLRELGVAENGELKAVVDVEATEYQDADSVWSNMVKGKDTLHSLPGVVPPSVGKTEWRYVEE